MRKEIPDEGYGKFHAGGRWLAHRFSYVWFMGGHERKKTLDRLCNRRLCTRPDHLQPISATINTERRDDRAFAAAGTTWHHAPIHHDTRKMDEWAAANGLPYGNPVWLPELTARPGKTSEPVHNDGG